MQGLSLPAGLRADAAPLLADGACQDARALLASGRAADAVVMLTKACQLHPVDARLLTLNGQALLALGHTGRAIGALFMALDLQPGEPDAHTLLAKALFQSGDMAQALAHRVAAFQLEPSAANAVGVSGTLIELNRYDEALALADHALGLQPGYFEALACRFMALEGLGRFADAVTAGRQVVAVAPANPAAQHDLAATLLGMGQLTAQAWRLYESRLVLHGKPDPVFSAKRWAGEDISGQTILLHAEQGLGDTLHFVRYAPLVAARAGRVVLAVQPALLRLLRAVPGVDDVIATGTALPPFDVVCPLLSLPGLFGTTLGSIPPALPYADAFTPWADASSGLRVGLVWAGSPRFTHDRQRSLSAANLAALAAIPGVQFYSLQRLEAATLPPPPALAAIDLMPGVRDFADTAARVAGLDLVVAVDTAVAHLAATMGKPVWLLSRFRGCWRWLHDRADTPWYPSMRIFRQERPNDWTTPITRIRHDLTVLAANTRSA